MILYPFHAVFGGGRYTIFCESSRIGGFRTRRLKVKRRRPACGFQICPQRARGTDAATSNVPFDNLRAWRQRPITRGLESNLVGLGGGGLGMLG
jgi:hypothetical protein